MNSTLKRSALALATVVACLTAMASPASAVADDHVATITGGDATLTPPTFVIPLAGGTGGCAAGTITIRHDKTVTPDTLDVTNLNTTDEFLVGNPVQTWVAQLSRINSTPGTHTSTGTGGTINNVRVGVQAVIRGPITPGSCDLTGPIRCTIRTRATAPVAQLNFSGTFNNAGGGSANEPEVGDVATVSSPNTALQTVPPCVSPFTTYNPPLGMGSVANMTVELTS